MKNTLKHKKILMVVDAWFPHFGGGQVHVWELSKHLAKLGYEIEIFTRNLGDWDEEAEGVKVIRTGHFKIFSNIFGRVEFLFLALIYSLTANYDIWHGHAFSPGLIAPFVKWIKRKPTVFTLHGRGVKIAGCPIGGSFLQDLVFYKISYSALISVAKSTLEKNLQTKNVFIIPNGINPEKFAPAIRLRSKIKKVIYIGRLSKEKGVDLLIGAFNRLGNRRLKLSIVGNGPEEQKLKQYQGKNIFFAGRLDGKDLVAELKSADLLVLPSRTEGLPVTLLEAWAAKLPILVTDVGDNSRLVKNGKNGFICHTNETAINNSLRNILKSKNLPEIAEAGYANALSLSWGFIVVETSSIYEKL